jgi:hypothetical protein
MNGAPIREPSAGQSRTLVIFRAEFVERRKWLDASGD